MTGCRQLAAFVLVLGSGLVFGPAGGWAQSTVETTIQVPSARKPKVTPRRPVAETPADDSEPTAERPVPPPADGDDERIEEEDARAARLSPSAGDASRDNAPEPEAPIDGIVVDGEAPPVVDGIPDLARDPRRPEDIAAFSQPPAGYDALAFQISDLDPLRDRRPDRLFRFEPYDPTGIRIGSFVLFPQAEFGGMWNSNVFRNSANLSDVAAEMGGSVRAVSDWRMHALELRASGRAGFYDEFVTENDRTWSVEARGRLDITRFANFEALVSHTMDKDVRALLDAPTDAIRRGDVETNRAAAAFNQKFNRLSLQLRGSITEVEYAPVASSGGGIVSNADRNYTQRDVAVRAGWALNREFGVFAEAAARERDYTAAPADGILRSSTGEQLRAGLAFAPFGPTLRGEISAGWGRQTPKESGLRELEGLLVDANLAWRASPLTTFLLTLRSDFYDTTATGSPGTLSRLAGLEVRHALRRDLIATASVRYTLAPYEGISLKDQDLTSELGLEYYLSRNAILFGRYQHVDFHSTDATRDYNADIFRLGIRLRQ